MKKLLFFSIASMLTLQLCAQSANPKYDKAMADSLGGDDYGMKAYVLVILKTGTANISDKKTTDSLFGGHMNNINHMANTGKLYVAGPMSKNEKNYRGIFILNVRTFEEANALIAKDPAVASKLLDVELYKWYGSAALGEYLKLHEKIEKKKM